MKRRQKRRLEAAHKATAPAPPTAGAGKASNAGKEEEKLDPREYFKLRSRTITKLKETRDPYPYPHKFNVTTDMREFVKEYDGLAKGEERKDVEVRVGGRIYTKVRLL